jgi:hypothetical protein
LIIDPTTPIAITLQAQAWNVVLAALAEQPYRISQPLIDDIKSQANAITLAAAPAEDAPLHNGSDHVSDR